MHDGAVATGRAIREIPPAERPRERLAMRGAAGLSAAELIALVWGSGSRGRSAVDLAEDALARHDGLTGLARATDVELEGLAGIGAAKAAQLTAAFELGRRLLADWPSGRWTIRSPGDVADRLILQMGRLEREELRVVLLNTKNVVLRVQTNQHMEATWSRDPVLWSFGGIPLTVSPRRTEGGSRAWAGRSLNSLPAWAASRPRSPRRGRSNRSSSPTWTRSHATTSSRTRPRRTTGLSTSGASG